RRRRPRGAARWSRRRRSARPACGYRWLGRLGRPARTAGPNPARADRRACPRSGPRTPPRTARSPPRPRGAARPPPASPPLPPPRGRAPPLAEPAVVLRVQLEPQALAVERGEVDCLGEAAAGHRMRQDLVARALRGLGRAGREPGLQRLRGQREPGDLADLR